MTQVRPEATEREERVARAICSAAGLKPDGLGGGRGPVITERHGNGFSQRETILPTWHRYLEEARKFLGALDAAGEP